jgi:non-canonical poly(A) RNA polymerase PAPD5/7
MSSDGPSDLQLDSKDEVGTIHGRDKDCTPRHPDAVAGPSHIHPAATKLKRRSKSKNKSSGSATPISLCERKSPAIMEEEPSFENNGDFIAFEPDDSLEDRDQHPREDNEGAREREWDKGKGKARERDGGGGKKRKADIDQNDGYNNKKQRTNAASRKAPWVADFDWEGSANVAELYAFFSLSLGVVV